MPKKKLVISGFTILMNDLKEKYASEGRNVPMREIQKIADPIWKNMTEAHKEEHNRRAKAYKKERQQEVKKLASDGTSVEENMEQELLAESRIKQMIKDIQQFIGSYQDLDTFRDSAARQHIYVISSNIMVITEKFNYIPIEIGICQYSVKEGLMKSFHKIIDPGPPPEGYAGAAKRHSEDTHKLPSGGALRQLGSNDYPKLWSNICKFLCSSSDELPPLFCLNDFIEQTYGCLKWICSKAGNPDANETLKVWDLAQLLHEMRSTMGAPIVSVNIATDMLKKNTFDYHPNTRCEFHEQEDSAFCALGGAQRLCFLLSDCLCSVFNIEPTEKHLPSWKTYQGYEVYIPSHGMN